VNSGSPVDVGTVLLAGGATGLSVEEATGGETIWKVVGTVGAGSESVNSPVGSSYTVVVTLVVHDVLEVDETWRVTVLVMLRLQELLVDVDSDSVQELLVEAASVSPASVAVLVTSTTEGMTTVEGEACCWPSGVFMADSGAWVVVLDGWTGTSLASLDVGAGAWSAVPDNGAWLGTASLALVVKDAGGAALYDEADVDFGAELDVGVVDGSAAFFLAGRVPFLIIRRAWVTSNAESCWPTPEVPSQLPVYHLLPQVIPSSPPEQALAAPTADAVRYSVILSLVKGARSAVLAMNRDR
jgi:hypothetical protein